MKRRFGDSVGNDVVGPPLHLSPNKGFHESFVDSLYMLDHPCLVEAGPFVGDIYDSPALMT